MQDHRKLMIWKRSHALAVEVRRAVRRLPRSGYGSLKSQMVSAAESVVLNIVEGCGAESTREFARFLGISIKSTTELEEQFELARDYGVMCHADWLRLTTEATDIRRMTYGLRARLREKGDEGGSD